jgi:hypothetical protein
MRVTVPAGLTLVAMLLPALAGCSGSARTESIAPPPAVGRVTLSVDSVRMDMYDTLRVSTKVFDATGTPINAPRVSFGSTHPAVATVDDDGLITALHGGRTEITATVEGVSAAAVVNVPERESYNVALAYGRITDRRGAPVLGTAMRAHVFFGDCNGPNLFDSKFSPNGVGVYRRTLAMPSFAATFRGCVILDVKPNSNSGFASGRSDPIPIRFVDSARGVPLDSVRIDVVLNDSSIVTQRAAPTRAARTSRMRSAPLRP